MGPKSISIFLTKKTATSRALDTDEEEKEPPKSEQKGAEKEAAVPEEKRAVEEKEEKKEEEIDADQKACEKCPKKLESDQQLADHMNDYHRIDSYACRNCKKGFICDKFTYQDHIKKCLRGEAETFGCPVCQKKFISKENCAIHQREQNHVSPVEKAKSEEKREQVKEEVPVPKVGVKSTVVDTSQDMLESRLEEENVDEPDEESSEEAETKEGDEEEEEGQIGGSNKEVEDSDEEEEERDAMEMEDMEEDMDYYCAYCDTKETDQAKLMEHVVNDHPEKDLKFRTKLPGGQGFSVFAWK